MKIPPVMFCLWVLLFMALFTVALAPRYEWFNTRVSNTSCPPFIKIAKNYIHVHNLDNLYQSAYKAGHSTETALLSIKNEFHLSLSRGEPTALVLLDLSAIPYVMRCLQYHRSFHSSQLPPYLVWRRWLSSEMVHFLPNKPLSVNKNWFYFVRCL